MCELAISAVNYELLHDEEGQLTTDSPDCLEQGARSVGLGIDLLPSWTGRVTLTMAASMQLLSTSLLALRTHIADCLEIEFATPAAAMKCLLSNSAFFVVPQLGLAIAVVLSSPLLAIQNTVEYTWLFETDRVIPSVMFALVGCLSIVEMIQGRLLPASDAECANFK